MTSDAGSRPPRPLLRIRARLAPPARTVSIAGRQVTTRGLERSFWADFYNNAMVIGWGAFLGYAALVFVGINAIFAVFYALGDAPIANDGGNSLPLLFFFSIETLATVGYGDMHPQTTYGHVLASVEMFGGLFLSALLTGLIFARFSRPRARFIFAEVVTVALHEGCPTIIVRVANGRRNMITNATAKLWVIRRRVNAEGVTYRGFEPLGLQKAENPVFALSWSLFHPLDEASPLFGLTAADLAASETSLLLALTGVDEATAQQVQGRRDYTIDTFRWNHRYADILGEGPSGEPVVDYTHFHMAHPLPASPAMDQLASASIAS
jgi:inward rectifier potassium channel